MIGNSSICDAERKVCKKDDDKTDSGVKRKGRQKNNNKNINKDKEKNKDKNNLIDKLLNNNSKDKLYNFRDKVLNNLTNIAKLKEKILINRKKLEEINIPIKDIRPNLDKYKGLNILYEDLTNHVWRMIYS